MAEPRVEILYFAGCPNFQAAGEIVEQVAADAGMRVDMRVIEVARPEDAERMHFIGSPTIRVDGRDVEPGADEREQFEYACGVYRTEAGFAGHPAAAWVRSALLSA